jgi:zinc and cadmium transporter
MIWIYTLISVSIVSLLSLIGVFTLSIDRDKLYKYLIYFVSLSAGTLMGDAFIHLIPDAYAENPGVWPSIYILLGILLFFILEKVCTGGIAMKSRARIIHIRFPTSFWWAIHCIILSME